MCSSRRRAARCSLVTAARRASQRAASQISAWLRLPMTATVFPRPAYWRRAAGRRILPCLSGVTSQAVLNRSPVIFPAVHQLVGAHPLRDAFHLGHGQRKEALVQPFHHNKTVAHSVPELCREVEAALGVNGTVIPSKKHPDRPLLGSMVGQVPHFSLLYSTDMFFIVTKRPPDCNSFRPTFSIKFLQNVQKPAGLPQSFPPLCAPGPSKKPPPSRGRGGSMVFALTAAVFWAGSAGWPGRS